MYGTGEAKSVKEFRAMFAPDTVIEYRVEGMHDKIHSLDVVDYMDDGGDYPISSEMAADRMARYALPRRDGTVIMYVTGDPRQRMRKYDMPEEIAWAMREYGWYSWCSDSKWKSLFDQLLEEYGKDVIRDKEAFADDSYFF